MEKVYARYKALNVKIICEPADQPFGIHNFFFEDPEGNNLECADAVLS